MRLSFRLAELHNYTPDPKRRPGVIKTICDHTGLDRHQVAALLRNEVKHIPLEALSRLCDYLVEQGLASAEKLPGALFAVEAEHFWELLARRRRLEICVGVRRGDSVNWPEGAWVVAADSVLMGEVLSGVSNLGGSPMVLGRGAAAPSDELRAAAATFETVAPVISPAVTAAAPTPAVAGSPGTAASPLRNDVLHPESLKQSLVWSPVGGVQVDDANRARKVYAEFIDSPGDKALVALGTTKSNPVAELVVASAFNLTPFESYDDVADPGQRGCPLYVRYRPTDPQPNSCWGGQRLSLGKESEESGIYYELPDGRWTCAPCDGRRHDAAYVFYAYREAQGWLEMALGGFSGRATRLLARTLMTRAENFWPPAEIAPGLRIGAFVVRYTFSPSEEHPDDLLRTDLVAQTEITAIDQVVLQRRLNPQKSKTKRTPGPKPK